MSLTNLQFSTNSLTTSHFSDLKFFNAGKNDSSHNLIGSLNQQQLKREYLIKIPIVHWQEQKQIYLWRLEQHPNILGLIDFKIISQNINFNNRILAKIQIEPYSHKLSELTQLNLIKTIQLMKQALRGIIILVQKFGIKILDDDNFVVGENGQVKVWICKKFQLNFSRKQSGQVISERNICQQISNIFMKITLKTKLSQLFFFSINNQQKLSQFLLKISQFEEEHHLSNLFLLSASKSTTSASNSYSSCKNLKFSERLIKKKPKKTLPKVQSMPYISFNIFESGILSQAQVKKSQHVNFGRGDVHNQKGNNSAKVSTYCPKKSSTTNWSQKINSGFLTPNPEMGSSKAKNNSLVISQVYQDDSLENLDLSGMKQMMETNKTKSIEKNIQNNSCFASGHVLKESWSKCLQFPKVTQKRKYSEDRPQTLSKLCQIKQHLVHYKDNLTGSKRFQNLQESTLRSQFIEEAVNPFDIIVNNGWSVDMMDFLSVPTVKQSVTLGKQQNFYKREMGLNKLDRLGRQCTESFFPVQEQEYSLEI